jgi:hypothetical protein
MSKDHPVSAQLLPNGAIVEGFPWLGGESKAVGLNSLGVRCLCKSHNSQLSPLDDAAGKLSRDMDEFAEVFEVRKRVGRRAWSLHYWEQDGALLERWCAKFLCTTLAGGLYGAQLPTWTPPVHLVEFVFGLTPLPPPAGLFMMRGGLGEVFVDNRVWGITPLGRPSDIEGATITFRHLRFAFLARPTKKEPTQIDLYGVVEDLLRHPNSIAFAGANLELRFRWKETVG